MVVFLVEEPSMAELLKVLLHRLFPDLSFLCLEHEGKQDLAKSVPRKLRAWRQPGVRFVVMRDQDSADCHVVKTGLKALCTQGGRADALVRVVYRELEAWYLGDVESLANAYPTSAGRLRRELGKSRYRDPDAVVAPSRVLEDLIPEFSKRSGARAMGGRLTRRNRSRSYRVFLEGVERLHRQLGNASQ